MRRHAHQHDVSQHACLVIPILLLLIFYSEIKQLLSTLIFLGYIFFVLYTLKLKRPMPQREQVREGECTYTQFDNKQKYCRKDDVIYQIERDNREV